MLQGGAGDTAGAAASLRVMGALAHFGLIPEVGHSGLGCSKVSGGSVSWEPYGPGHPRGCPGCSR